jgi:long-chain acyl-CoA synthetase
MQQHDDLNLNIISRVAIGDVLRRRSRDAAESEALVEFVDGERQAISYRDLNNRVNQIGRGLRAHGLQQGDRIALVSGNSIDFVAVLFACYKIGVVAVPVNFLQQADDVRYNFEHGEVKAIIYQSVLEELCSQCAIGLDAISLNISIGKTNGAAHTTLDALADSQVDDEIMDVIINDRDVAQILYTSGTTSRPKGVETSHLALVMASMNTPINLEMRKGCASLSVLPLFHVTAICGLHSCMQVSGKYVIHAGFDPGSVVNTLEQESIAMTIMLPMMWDACLAVPDMAARDYRSITTALYGMAPMSSPLLARLREAFGCDFHLGSGQTEFTPIPCIFYDHSPTEFGEGNYWGVATSIVEQAVLDDHGNECAVGEVGEICWRGPLSMNGYLKNPQATAEVRLHGWHHSGDLGFIDAKGQLMFVDRKKDIIKTGGENVSSCKVEGVLTAIDGIVLSAVVGVPHPRWSEAICAVVQRVPGKELSEDDVIAYCKQHLGGFEVPKRVIFVDAIDVTSTGKVKKPELRQQYANLFTDS